MKQANEQFQMQEKQLVEKGYSKKDVTLSSGKATILGLLYALPLVVVSVLCYRFLLFDRVKFSGTVGISFYAMFIAIIVVSVVIHEVLHGIGWIVSSGKGWGIVRFNISALTPSCACRVPLHKKAYLIGVLTPITVLGIFCILFLFIYPSDISFLTAIVNFIAAGADLVIASNVLKEKDVLIVDHPTEPGYIAYVKW